MKVFISSLIQGMEPIRDAARTAVTMLRHEPIMAEDFRPQPNSPQVACLSGLRQADLVVLVLGEHYGAAQQSGISPTHEEYREGQGRKPVIAFVQAGVSRNNQQADFVKEVQGWEGGLFRGSFSTPQDLQAGIVQALHDYEMSQAVGAVDPKELVERAIALLPASKSNGYASTTSFLMIAIAGGPTQQVLRPIEIENSALCEALMQAAMFGEHRILDREVGVSSKIERSVLEISQKDGAAGVQLDEQGGIRVWGSPIERQKPRGGTMGGFAALIEEQVQRRLSVLIGYAAWVLEQIDKTQRLSHVGIAAKLDAGGFMAWRTQAEHDDSPNGGQVLHMPGETPHPAISADRPRAALRLDTNRW